MDNLLLANGLSPGKISQSATVIPRCYAFSGRFKLSSLERNRCPVCAGLTVQFAVDWVSSLPWNQCPVWCGIRTLMKKIGIEAIYTGSLTPAAAIRSIRSIPTAARSEDQSAQPGIRGRHHVHPDEARLHLSVRGDGLGQQAGAVEAAVEYDDDGFLH
jgi:hypothetical protein